MSDPNFHITTLRLYLSYLNPSNDIHCDHSVALLHSPSSIAFNPNGPILVPDRSAARSFLEAGAERLTKTGYGRYLVSLRSPDSTFSEPTSNLIGVVTCQLHRYPSAPGPLIPDIGFNFLPEFHGKGYAGEAARGLMEWYREERGTRAFAALTDEGNVGAKGLLKKLGFRDEGLRRVRGVVGGGREEELSVWTIGVEEGRLGELGL